ncbi:MAG: SDR family NAD(P)-dependent oxidoreductase [Leptolyngbya sp. PLA1]|nr:SDR family NAD(P)-dependent oxidoreductase [Leptolyngbya sp. PLA1]
MTTRTALVTGATSGIGLHVARQLANAGFRVALCARGESGLARAASSIGPSTVTLAADLFDPHAAAGVVDRAITALGRLDVLVNNAGWSPAATIPQTDPDTATRVFALNAVAPTVMIARAWSAFERQHAAGEPGGVVVNVSSIASVDPFPILYAYAAAKAAVNNLAISVAAQGAAIGVRGFAVAPGAVETPLLRSLVDPASLPAEMTLRPEDVAAVVVACVRGERDESNGRTIFLPSP